MTKSVVKLLSFTILLTIMTPTFSMQPCDPNDPTTCGYGGKCEPVCTFISKLKLSTENNFKIKFYVWALLRCFKNFSKDNNLTVLKYFLLFGSYFLVYNLT